MTAALLSPSPEQTELLGAALGAVLRAGDVVLLTGDLGAGKTQFTKGIAHALGVREAVTSPTFNLILEYDTANGGVLRHFDLYRLEDADELGDIDYFGLIEGEAISVVEWGDKFSEALPLDYLLVAFALDEGDARRLSLTAAGERGAQLLAEARTALLAANGGGALYA
ncbi:MAG: tRNA (adenosine(37)-N6)-threonylcarbamoyltransferase complex ATPase subunit type 1 TsaE [Coriobacteriales bacterium]|jgi:tRNA threonylcarbamoyladenosine biosynthesis protein TsaE|nr:tRNA (adenosine(37)-N6)-threonylcarbamoyltransferase complex ATPase subunit type 1 TsaE [Coriobacteriales bacterium]